MGSSLLNLRDQLIIDAGVEGDPRFPNPRLNRMISLAERYVQTELAAVGYKRWEKMLTVTTSGGVSDGLNDAAFNSGSNNVSTITIPFTDGALTFLNDLLENPSSILFLDCKYVLSAASSYGLAYEIDKDRFKESLSNTYFAPTKKQPIFMRLGKKIWIAPLTDTASNYKLDQVDIYYQKVITDISTIISPATTADANTTEIPIEFEELMLRKAKLEVDIVLDKIQNRDSALKQIQTDIATAYKKFVSKQVEMNRAYTQNLKSKMQ